MSDETEVAYDDPVEPVRRVHLMLSEVGGLPAELILKVTDLAEYYPTIITKPKDSEPVTMSAGDSGHWREYPCSSRLYLISRPITGPRGNEKWRMKKVKWYIEGRDQGWGGEAPGTFYGAYSWYEACIFRPDSSPDSCKAAKEQNEKLDAVMDSLYRNTHDMVPVLDQQHVGWSLVPNARGGVVWYIQANKVAAKEYGEYTVEWRAGQSVDISDAKRRGQGDGMGFLEALLPGDRVGLMMCAQYPGWKNTLKHASVELMFEVR